MREICVCGHNREEHEDTFFAPCKIEGCDCIAFEDSDEDKE
jgi:hypothetical protein